MLLEDRGIHRGIQSIMVEVDGTKHVANFPLKIFAKFWLNEVRDLKAWWKASEKHNRAINSFIR